MFAGSYDDSRTVEIRINGNELKVFADIRIDGLNGSFSLKIDTLIRYEGEDFSEKLEQTADQIEKEIELWTDEKQREKQDPSDRTYTERVDVHFGKAIKVRAVSHYQPTVIKLSGKGNGNEREVYISGSVKDTTEVLLGRTRLIVESDGNGSNIRVIKDTTRKRKVDNHLELGFGLDLGINMYLSDGTTTLPGAYTDLDQHIGKSMNVNLNLLRLNVKLSDYWWVTTGVSMYYNNYRFNNNVRLVPQTTELTFFRDSISYKKNKLVASYLMMPFLLHYDDMGGDDDHKFRFAIGPNVGILMRSHTKWVNSRDGKTKFNDNFSLNKLRYGVRAEIGYGWFNLYADYMLSPLFSSGKGPELNGLTIGLRLLGI